MTTLELQGQAARQAARVLARTGTREKNEALEAIAQGLLRRQEEILTANQEDVAAARESGMSQAMLDRLTLTAQRIAGIVEGKNVGTRFSARRGALQ